MNTAAARAHCVDTSATLAHYDFDLPPELIAQHPAPQRDGARLMIVDRATANRQHRLVSDLPDHLRAGDLLVVNDTRVLPARLRAHLPSGAKIELLALHPCGETTSPVGWRFMARPAKRLRLGAEIVLAGGARATVVRLLEEGRCELAIAIDQPLQDYLQLHGEVPLPPYIRRDSGPSADDLERYQTMFARNAGAVAAPTAGLHFTPELVRELDEHDIHVAPITLHVGAGTFLPIRTDDYRGHKMGAEWFEIPAATAAAVQSAKRERRRVVAVGTTTTRALESAATEDGIAAGASWSEMFITPGYRFRVIDALFTNFHLPKSTLLLLVSAFAGRETVLAAYEEAVARRYRFYSYGDAMLIS